MGERQAVYTVSPRGEGKKDFWCRIGTAFTNRDGSLSVLLDANPVNGKLVIRREEPKEERDEEPPPRRQQRPQQRPQSRQEDFGGSPGGDDDIPF